MHKLNLITNLHSLEVKSFNSTRSRIQMVSSLQSFEGGCLGFRFSKGSRLIFILFRDWAVPYVGSKKKVGTAGTGLPHLKSPCRIKSRVPYVLENLQCVKQSLR
jgi:hypothetical protein